MPQLLPNDTQPDDGQFILDFLNEISRQTSYIHLLHVSSNQSGEGLL